MRRPRAKMEVRDSRRLTGPNLHSLEAGAILDIYCDDPEQASSAISSWEMEAYPVLEALGWDHAELTHRRYPQGFSLVLEAPIDSLYLATEVNELIWAKVEADLGSKPFPEYQETLERLREAIRAGGNPRLLALQRSASNYRKRFLWDDDQVSVGMGVGSRTWPADALPEVSEVPWDELRDIPAALITGTNGKTTTVRLLAAMVRAAGLEPGFSSTDGVWVDGEEIGEGDYSGPGGARLVLRDQRVEVGLLETARGGILRRGLGLLDAEAALVTNVAEDHLGEWGVHDLEELAATKLVVAQGARQLVLNGDDPLLWRLWQEQDLDQDEVPWVFSLDPASKAVISTLVAGGEAYVLDEDELQRWSAGEEETLVTLAEMPMALGGAARHNVANALGASAVAVLLGLPMEAIRQGLRSFGSSSEENPGRLNRFDLGGVQAIVDFAHNPHGVEALLTMATAMPAERRLILIGQAGDRSEADIRALARGVWRHRPDLVIAKELGDHLRGREKGEIPAMLASELRLQGAPEEAVATATSELAAVRQAFEWAKPGDLLLLISHERRQEVLAWVQALESQGWRPGQELPSLG